MPTVSIQRPNMFASRFLPYRVLLNDRLIGHLKNNERKEYIVQAGHHTIQISCFPGLQSAQLSFQIEEGEEIEFEAVRPLKENHAKSDFLVICGIVLVGILFASYQFMEKPLGLYRYTPMIITVLFIIWIFCTLSYGGILLYYQRKNKPLLYLRQIPETHSDN